MSASSESAGPHLIVMEITSDPALLGAVRDAGENLALEIGFGTDVAGRVALALDEALSNVIKHGYGGRRGLPISIRMERIAIDGKVGIQIVIQDEAEPVDPSLIKSRDLDDIRPGGLGVHLMRTIMDRVEYTPWKRGMTLEMVKFLNRGQVQEA